MAMVRSSPAECVEALVVDAEVVRDFVDNGNDHLFAEFLCCCTEPLQRAAKEDDAVRQAAHGPPGVTLSEGDTFIDPEQGGILGRWLRLDEEGNIVELGRSGACTRSKASPTSCSNSCSVTSTMVTADGGRNKSGPLREPPAVAATHH